MKLTLIALSLCLLGTSWLLTTTYKSALMLEKEYNAARESRSELCLLKAARVANAVDPRFYTESTVKNIYKSCLNE